jgi:hypothetical protein
MEEVVMSTMCRKASAAALTSAALGVALGLGLFGCSSSSSNNGGGGTDGGKDGSVADSPSGSDGPSKESGPSEGGGGDAGPGEAGPSGNVVIADQYNNRVIEIDSTGHIVWTFGDGNDVPGPTSVVGPNDEERLPNGQTLIAGTGIPGPMAGCTLDGGCPDNRVLIVDHDGGIVWEYDADGGLNTPVCSVYLPNGNVLITDQGNARVIEVTPQKAIVWTYQPLGTDGGPALNSPNSAERLASGNTLVTDENNNRVLEVSSDGGLVWQYPPATADGGLLSGAAFASRLPNGNTLITSANNALILEVNTAGSIVWSYNTAARTMTGTTPTGTEPAVDGGNPAPLPTRAIRLQNGDTLISDQLNHQVIEIDSAGTIVHQYGQLNVPGNGAGQLNGPYDAKRVGDFNGLTPPQ